MTQKPPRKPKIVVTESDLERLTGLATAALERIPEVAEELLNEMDRAKVVSPKQMPADVVRMGSIVEFSSDTAQQRRVQLVFPGEADIEQGRISILTPIGTALIGLAAGQSIAWTARDGRQHTLTVLTVEQPAATPEKTPA
ncbi:nucleoside diphosphate kinase regulator [Bosea sp. (in: a-proteobacteria)]|jgi:regulator of nucleoside diphosphate kinase|uniref:nucleoside diphosphate kinase regulator n=1 Tax=Bosea sp. (in: a-proteobacteria) TaxID=1871050 RepID=UPI00086E59D6|nr:nucleoside diphosphate kinase regulator [Bosea sp. (in: a-proteobacteria)]MBN9439869.1 nucleoside diphosphate kinase regulator [Bosea sp. (in: a-proteobacteria)]ODT46291.1 MAG: nucleoside diphosphate kinase regulator [Methylobacterium sp. SCN 67-24]